MAFHFLLTLLCNQCVRVLPFSLPSGGVPLLTRAIVCTWWVMYRSDLGHCLVNYRCVPLSVPHPLMWPCQLVWTDPRPQSVVTIQALPSLRSPTHILLNSIGKTWTLVGCTPRLLPFWRINHLKHGPWLAETPWLLPFLCTHPVAQFVFIIYGDASVMLSSTDLACRIVPSVLSCPQTVSISLTRLTNIFCCWHCFPVCNYSNVPSLHHHHFPIFRLFLSPKLVLYYTYVI